MQKLKDKGIQVQAREGMVRLKRNEYGVPTIRADSLGDVSFGLGWLHAFDRPVELELTRLIAKGRAAQYLKASSELVAADVSMRRH